jgi:hypothetical protein
VPPHPGRRHEQADEALAAGRGVHRLHGHAAAAQDAATSREVFGTYIHTYKFAEAVADKVVLDLKYEARDVAAAPGFGVPPSTSWFDLKTKALNNWQKAVLRKRWGTMEELMSSKSSARGASWPTSSSTSSPKPRLNNDRGTAMLVASSRSTTPATTSELFQNTSFGGATAASSPRTSRNHNASLEDTGARQRRALQVRHLHPACPRRRDPDHQAIRGREAGQAALQEGAGES